MNGNTMNTQNILGTVQKLFLAHKDTKKRAAQQHISVDPEGIIGDKFYGKNKERSVLLVATLAYEMMNQKDISAHFGDLSENIVVDFNPYLLKEGTQLRIGEVVLQITHHCTLCDSLKTIDPCVPTLLANDRGVFAQVIKSGVINENQTISIL